MTQPEALRLADAIAAPWLSQHEVLEAAAELRRLHAELERCKQVCSATSESWRTDAESWKAQRKPLTPVQEPPCATRECMPSQCPNCASLEAQNTELDRKLADLEQTSLELCNVCGWKTLIPGDCCLNCERKHPLGQASTDVGVPVYVVKKAEPVQEPVGYANEHDLKQMHYYGRGALLWGRDQLDDLSNYTPLYTTPPQRPAEPVQALDWLHKWANQDDGEPETQWHEGYEAARRVVQIHLTAPPQRKPLTEGEIYEMYNEPSSDAEMVAFARAIERAHGIT